MKYTATVLIADGTPDSTGHALDSEAVTWPEGGVPVRMGIGEDAPIVGHATLTLDGFAIVAEVELNDADLEDRTEDEVGELVPAIAGMGDPEAFDLEVQYVALGEWENADGRITSLVPPPLHEANDNGDCDVCGEIITDETPWCPGPPDTPLKKVLDFPVPPEEDDAGPMAALHQEAVEMFGDIASKVTTTDEDGNEITTVLGEE